MTNDVSNNIYVSSNILMLVVIFMLVIIFILPVLLYRKRKKYKQFNIQWSIYNKLCNIL
jgi:heme/copper-type cytochrome/quinol oxidase subunit 2